MIDLDRRRLVRARQHILVYPRVVRVVELAFGSAARAADVLDSWHRAPPTMSVENL